VTERNKHTRQAAATGAPLVPGSIRDRLDTEAYRFSFYQAVRLLESFAGDKQQLGRSLTPREEAIRFTARPGVHFPPSDISSLVADDADGRTGMEVTFLGLIGPSGVLPHWYNELALERLKSKDGGFTAFLDIFHHRLISLFYLAWKKFRFPENYIPGAHDRLSGYVLSLIGLGTVGLRERVGVPAEPLLFCSGLLSRTVTTAYDLEAVIEYFSGERVTIRQWVDRIIPLAPEDQSQIGFANGSLGVNTVCGNCTWENQTKFRVVLGPMSFAAYSRFLPSGDLHPIVVALARQMSGMEFEFDIQVMLRREEVPGCRLGGLIDSGPRLGWTSWIKSPGIPYPEDAGATFENAGL
jgi:type VI secretion system protein ImpH